MVSQDIPSCRIFETRSYASFRRSSVLRLLTIISNSSVWCCFTYRRTAPAIACREYEGCLRLAISVQEFPSSRSFRASWSSLGDRSSFRALWPVDLGSCLHSSRSSRNILSRRNASARVSGRISGHRNWIKECQLSPSLRLVAMNCKSAEESESVFGGLRWFVGVSDVIKGPIAAHRDLTE